MDSMLKNILTILKNDDYMVELKALQLLDSLLMHAQSVATLVHLQGIDIVSSHVEPQSHPHNTAKALWVLRRILEQGDNYRLEAPPSSSIQYNKLNPLALQLEFNNCLSKIESLETSEHPDIAEIASYILETFYEVEEI